MRTLACLSFSFLLCSVISAEETNPDASKAEPVSYWRDIRPIFQEHCHGCHQPAKKAGDYEMTDFQAMLTGGETGEAAIVAGKPDDSYLVAQIVPVDGEAEMPKGKPPIESAKIELVRKWIEQGAKDDTPETAVQKYDAKNPPVYQAMPVVTSIDYSPDGKLIAVSGYHEVILHDATKAVAGEASMVGRLVGQSERIEAVTFSPDGKMLAIAGGSPGRLGEVQIWNVADRKLQTSYPVGYDTCYGASWSPDGKLVAFGMPDNTIRAIEASSGKQVLFNGAHNDWVLDTVFSVKGDYVVSVSRDMSMKLYEVGPERFVDNITSITPGALKGGLHAVDRHPGKDELLIGGADGVPKIYRMFREKDRKIGDDFNLIRKLPEMRGRVFDAEFNKDGSRAVAGSSYNGVGQVLVFNADEGKTIKEMEGPFSAIYAVAFDPNGKHVLSGGFDGHLYIHEIESGKLAQKLVPVPLDMSTASASK